VNAISHWCPERESNPQAPFGAADFKSAVSTSFTTRATVADSSGRSASVLRVPRSAGATRAHPPCPAAALRVTASCGMHVAEWRSRATAIDNATESRFN
jgi:hypothetical protein